jgi:putative ABC transport system permease protein
MKQLFAATRSRLFLRMLRQSLAVRRAQSATALLALSVLASVATAMLSLYFDLDSKLHKEFRTYGANVVVTARDGQAFPKDVLQDIRSVMPDNALALPFAYAVAHGPDGVAIVVAGTDLSRVQQLNRWWSVSRWPSAPGEALVGERAARVLGSKREFTLTFGDKPLNLISAGTLKTGAAEEERVYLSLAEFERWTGLGPSAVEVALPGSRQEIDSQIEKLSAELSGADVHAVRQIVEAEGAVISKTKLLIASATLLIAITVALCILATLTSSVLERRRDFAVMKALGSSQAVVNSLFAGEAVLIGVSGAVVGYIVGSALAAWIGHVNFHAAIFPKLSVFPVVLMGTIAVALLAALVPLSQLQRLEPAVILKGE